MTSEPGRARGMRLPLALFAGAVLAIQLGWFIGTPPFTQMDGIDHAYRAASVAHGHFTDRSSSSDARGNLIRVPLTMVDAAHDACVRLRYMKPGNCSPMSAPDSQGDVLVGSAAATYNPAYYLIVGIPAVTLAPHSGTGMLMIMRAMTMLWCDLLIAAAVVLTSRFTRKIWPTLGVMITAMPVLLCASVSAAPNGVQMASGLLMWAAMCSLIFGEPKDARSRGWLLGLWAFGSCCVLVTHSTGPAWFGISFLIGLALLGRTRIGVLCRESRAGVLAAVGIVGLVGILSVLWTVMEKTNIPTTLSGNATPHVSDYVGQPLVWLLQCISAVPFRNTYAPAFVYAIGLGLIGGFVTAAFRQRYRAGRWALTLIVAIALVISLTLNFLTYGTQGNAWQGRYTLSLTYGVPLLSAWIISVHGSGRHWRDIPDRLIAMTVGIAIGVINAASLIKAWYDFSKPRWPSHGDLATPPSWLIVGLACLTVVLMTAATERLARHASLNTAADSALL